MQKNGKISNAVIPVFAFTVLTAVITGCGSPYVVRETEETRQKRLEKFQTIISPDAQPVLVYDGARGEPRLGMTEGPSWLGGKLYFTNMNFRRKNYEGSGMCVLYPDDGSCKLIKENVFAVGTTPLANGNLAVCYIKVVDEKPEGSVVEMTPESEVVRTIADSADGIPFGLPNDLITDNKGGIYFTDPWGGKRGKNQHGTAVYYANPNGKVTRLTEWNEHRFPNGCVLSADGSRFFLNDDTETVWVFDVNADGTFSNKRSFAKLILHKHQRRNNPQKSLSDGMTIDSAGNLYVTSEIGIQVFDKTGKFLGVIHFPKIPSHCVFGGDDLSVLYATCRDRIYSIQTKMKGYQYPIK